MKKLVFFALALALLLISCTPEEPEENLACDTPDSSYPILTYETWNQLTYALPWCWTFAEIVSETTSAPVLRLNHGEGEMFVNITVTPNQGDPSSAWGPPENSYGEYFYYRLQIQPGTMEYMRFENGTKISVITQDPLSESLQSQLEIILNSLSLTP